MNFHLPPSEQVKLDALKKDLDDHDIVVEGSKNDETISRVPNRGLDRYALRSTFYQFQR